MHAKKDVFLKPATNNFPSENIPVMIAADHILLVLRQLASNSISSSFHQKLQQSFQTLEVTIQENFHLWQEI